MAEEEVITSSYNSQSDIGRIITGDKKDEISLG